MSTTQYLPLAEPITFTGDATPALIWTYGALPPRRAPLPPQPGAPPPVIVSDLPILEASPLVMRRTYRRLEGYAPNLVALPYDKPLMDHSPIVVRRVYMRLQGEAHPLAPGQYDLPLPEPWRDPIARPRKPIPTQSAEWGRSDVTTIAWVAPPNQPVRPPVPRQIQLAPARNLVPIVPAAAPANSWGPSAEIPVRRLPFFGLWPTYVHPISPITTAVTIVSSWVTASPITARRRGMGVALQQTSAEPPPAIEVIVQAAPWRSLFPDWLRRPRWLWGLLHLPGPPNQHTVASGIGCIMVDQPGLTESLLLSPHVEASTLVDPTMTGSTLKGPELC